MKKKVDLKYIREQGLREVEIKEISIDHTGKRVEFTLLGFSGTKVLKMELLDITLLEISKSDTFYSPEIILEYRVDEKKQAISLYTTSDTVYRIKFGEYSCSMEMESDPEQGFEEFSCRVDLQDNQTLKKPGLSNTPAFGRNKAGNVIPFTYSRAEHSADIVPPESLTTNSPLKTFSV